jgi:putative toxin-antitoxin system antitoxin component (TIGR02293 family)
MGHTASIATTAARQPVSSPRQAQSGRQEEKRPPFSLRPGARKPVKKALVRKPALSLAASERIAKADAAQLLEKFAERSPLSMGSLRGQLISDSTWKRSEATLGPAASQTIARLAHTLLFATRTWQNEAQAIDWLLGPHAELGGATPFSLLRTESGGREVEYIMAALEYGFSL